ncbi:hypothetical protein EDB81DRAFT_476313 [Dactylonectria macrodidyma]|uniref:Secreted protein n=1 Tax=Dactylonectria macrodidyma TaxID=307937 RepID=A0A9P9F0G7_9HYPO|nr:hypothetical protein EDB81DRAFT_476313 [Dactylonectria macrodidyma]
MPKSHLILPFSLSLDFTCALAHHCHLSHVPYRLVRPPFAYPVSANSRACSLSSCHLPSVVSVFHFQSHPMHIRLQASHATTETFTCLDNIMLATYLNQTIECPPP